MTYPPKQTFNVRNDGVGLVNTGALPPLVVGYSPLATPGTLYQYSNPNTARDELGLGPALEDVLAAIEALGICYYLATAASTAGSSTAVEAERVDSSTGTVTVAGAPELEFNAKVQIVKTGKKGVGTFRYTLDGRSYGATRIIPSGGTFAVPNTALILTFTGTPGSSAVTQTGSGPAVTVTGTPTADNDFEIEMTLGGAVATATFQWRRNGGTWTTGVTTAATVLLTGGVTANFAAGTYVDGTTYTWSSYISTAADFEAGDLHEFTCTAPHYTVANLNTAWGGLQAQLGSREFGKCVFTGRNADTGDGATMAAACAALLADFEAELYFVRGHVDAGNGTPEEYRADFAAFADDRIDTVYEPYLGRNVRASFEGYSDVDGPGVTAAAERSWEADLSENLGRKASGALTRVTRISHDEGVNTAFGESERVTTFRTYQGQQGFFITNGFLRSSPSSDFAYWDWGCTVDEFCRAIRDGQDPYILAKLRVETDGSGHLSSLDAQRIKDSVLSIVDARLMEPKNVEGFAGHVSGRGYEVDTTNNFLSTRQLLSTGSVVPLVPVEGFTTTVGLARSVEA